MPLGGVALDGGGSSFALALRRREPRQRRLRYSRVRARVSRARRCRPACSTNSATESDAAALGASWLGDSGFLGVAVNVFDTLYGIPGRRKRSAVRIDLDAAARRSARRAGWTSRVRSKAVNREPRRQRLRARRARGRRGRHDVHERRHRAHGSSCCTAPSASWSGAFGVQCGDREFAAIGEEAFVPPVDTCDARCVHRRAARPRTRGSCRSAGASSRRSTRRRTACRASTTTATSVSFGGVRSFGDELLAGAESSRSSERLPVAEELYSDGPHLATGAVQIGDPTLRAETAQHVDVGFRGEGGGLTWSVTAFAHAVTTTSSISPIPAPSIRSSGLPIFVYTQADAEFSGLEAELFVPMHRRATPVSSTCVCSPTTCAASSRAASRCRACRRCAMARASSTTTIACSLGLEGDALRRSGRDRRRSRTLTPGYTLINADFRWRLVDGQRQPSSRLFVNAEQSWATRRRASTRRS